MAEAYEVLSTLYDAAGWGAFAETHTQRRYPVATIRALLEQAGLTVLTVCDAFAEGAPEPGPKTGRVLIVARKRERNIQ